MLILLFSTHSAKLNPIQIIKDCFEKDKSQADFTQAIKLLLIFYDV